MSGAPWGKLSPGRKVFLSGNLLPPASAFWCASCKRLRGMSLTLFLTDFGRELLLAAGAALLLLASLLFLMRHHPRDESGVRPPRNPPTHSRF